MEAVGHRQGQLHQGHFLHGGGVQNHQVAAVAFAVPDHRQQPAVVLGAGAGAGHHQRLTDKAVGGGAPDPPFAAAQVEFLEGLQRIVAGFALGDGHPGIAGGQALLAGIDHGEFTAALTEALAAHGAGRQVEAAAFQQAGGDQVEIDGAVVRLGINGGEVGVVDALHNHLLALLVGIEVVEDKTFGRIEHPGRFAGVGATVPGHQPKAGLATGLGAQALGRSLEP